jgi:hypothetical protein
MLKDGQVLFRWKDYADDHRLKVMRLTAADGRTDQGCAAQMVHIRS